MPTCSQRRGIAVASHALLDGSCAINVWQSPRAIATCAKTDRAREQRRATLPECAGPCRPGSHSRVTCPRIACSELEAVHGRVAGADGRGHRACSIAGRGLRGCGRVRAQDRHRGDGEDRAAERVLRLLGHGSVSGLGVIVAARSIAPSRCSRIRRRVLYIALHPRGKIRRRGRR